MDSKNTSDSLCFSTADTMEQNYDIFAGLTDYCDNYKLDEVTASDICPKDEDLNTKNESYDSFKIMENCSRTIKKNSNQCGLINNGEEITCSIISSQSGPPDHHQRTTRHRKTDRNPNRHLANSITHQSRQNDRENMAFGEVLDPRVIDYIDLDSLESTCSTSISVGLDKKLSQTDNANLSFDIENVQISLKIKWRGKIEVFQYRKHQKFIDLMNILAKRENVKMADVLLNLNDRIIDPDDTPDEIDYKIFQFISGRTVETLNTSFLTKTKDPNTIELKVQSDSFKKPFDIIMKKTQPFKVLYIKCSEELKLPYNQIKLSFDGETLNVKETPINLELEGGEIIDCHLNKIC